MHIHTSFISEDWTQTCYTYLLRSHNLPIGITAYVLCGIVDTGLFNLCKRNFSSCGDGLRIWSVMGVVRGDLGSSLRRTTSLIREEKLEKIAYQAIWAS